WEYMSPEQAVLNQLDVDTRTDVYSLGVMLYELMTGITPLDRERLRRVQLQELLRIIQEEEPPKPSTRLSGTASSTKSLATYRTVSPQELTRFVRGDLDWITMKALEKDRKRRYESASRLADDLGRFLAGDAIEARPPTWGYRASKLVRRYKLPIATATLALIGLVASTCIIAGFWLNSRKLASHRQMAIDALIQKQVELEQKQDQLVKEKQRVQKSRYLADMQNAYFAWLDNDVNEVKLLLALYRNSKSIGWEYRHLQALVEEANYEVFVETPSPLELACSPSEDLLVVSSTTNSSAFTVFRDGRQVGQLGKVAPGKWLFHYAQFSDSGDVFLRSSDDFSEIIIHDSSTLAVKRKLNLPGELLGKRSVRRFGRCIFSRDSHVWAVVPNLGIVHFDLSQPVNHVKLLVEDNRVKERGRLAVSSDGSKLFYSAGKRLTAVDLDGEKARVSTSVETESNVLDLVVLDQHGLLATASKNGVVALWNASDLSVHRVLKQFDDEARSLAFWPSKNQLVVGARDRQAVIFDTEKLTEVAVLRDTNGLYALEFDRDGNLLFGASRGRVCPYRKHQKANQLLPIPGKPVSIDFVDRHRLLIVCEKSGSLLLVDCNSGTVEQIDPSFDGTISAVSTPVDGNILAVDSMTQAIVSLNLVSGATDTVGTFEGQGKISAIELHAGQVFVGTDTGEVYLVENSKQTLLFDSGVGMVREIARSSPDSLYVSNSGGTVCHYEVGGGIQRQEFKGDVRALKASKDAIAIGLYHSTHNSGNLFLKVANQLQPIRGHTFSIMDLDLLHDGSTIVTAGADRRLKFWDRASGEQRISLHLGGVPNALATSPDGTTFALALREGYVQVLRATN
ncbi:MAG TPA: hypothetical protein DDW52_24585, partial [Planctomycetaceae bacterium]|nr:hypothetical protein [Planctomycetaceae bacterium]